MRRMYSENQVVNLLENKDVKAKTLLQEEYNWQSTSVNLNSTWLHGLTVVNSFIKCVQVNRRIDIIVSCAIKNETGSAISTSAQSNLFSSSIVLPEELSKLIYRKDGTTCNNARDSIDGIITAPLILTNNTGGVATILTGLLAANEANKINVWVPAGNSVSVAANAIYLIDYRVSILL